MSRGTAIVAGGGIGGLAAAAGLRRAGWSAVVLEQAPIIAEVGAGLSLWPNALAALDVLALGDAVRAAGVTAVSRGGMRAPSGKWLRRRHPRDISVLMVHRADLHQVLLDALPPEWLRTGARVTSVEQDDAEVTVTYEMDGGTRQVTGDIVVGADGIDSAVRRLAWPEASPPVFDGRTAWRGVTRPGTVPGEESITAAREQSFGMMPLPGMRTYWFLTADAPFPGVRSADELAEVRRRMAGWHEPIAAMLDATDPGQVSHHDFYRLDPVPGYARGRVVLLGDAAHAQPPDLGQGACQALEDAAVLAAEIARSDDPAAALAGYDEQRRPRTQAMTRAADRQHQLTARHFAAVTAALRVMPPALWRRQVTRWTDWTPPTLPAPPSPATRNQAKSFPLNCWRIRKRGMSRATRTARTAPIAEYLPAAPV